MKRNLSWMASIVAVSALASTGCVLAQLAYFIIPGDGGMPPKVKLLNGRRETKKIVCIPYADSGMRFSFDALDSDLNSLLVAEITGREKRFDVVPERKVRAWRDQNQNWADSSLQQIGEHFDVDYVLFYEIRRFSLNETKNQFLLQGGTTIRIKIHDVTKDATIHEDSYQREYPPERSVPVSEVLSEEQFRKRFLRTVAREISWQILPHELRDTIDDL